MTDVFSTFDVEVKKKHDEMLADIESISADNIKSEGVILSFGGKAFKFTDLEIIENDSLEDRIRNELREQLNNQQGRIREKINSKINQLLLIHQQKKQEFERKEQKLKNKYSESAMMPGINEGHLVQGLSVYKGDTNNELIWSYRGLYNPRFVSYYDSTSSKKIRKPIPVRYVKRMKKEIVFLIKTKNQMVTSIITKIISDDKRRLKKFSHYHKTSSSGDCWGKWKWDPNWSTPTDIIKLAKNAEAVLEVINKSSIATENPTSLPRINTLMKVIAEVEEVEASTVEREGGNDIEDDVWQAV